MTEFKSFKKFDPERQARSIDIDFSGYQQGVGQYPVADNNFFLFSTWFNLRSEFPADIATLSVAGTTVISTWQWAGTPAGYNNFLRDVNLNNIIHTNLPSAPALNKWNHILISVDTSDLNTYKMYLNDTEINYTLIEYNGGIIPWSTIDLTRTYYVSPNGRFDGNHSDLYLTNEYLDLTIESNRRKFITADGRPANLGNDGSLPTGTQPMMYFKGDAKVRNSGKNFGSGPTFVQLESQWQDSDASVYPVKI